MVRWDLLNRIADQIGARWYLEIGVQAGHAFSRIEVENKVGVDPDPRSAATVHLPSDSYFDRLDSGRDSIGIDGSAPLFDLVFVDGLHHREQVVRDVLNAQRYLAPGGVIVMHDCDPPTRAAGGREMCSGVWCGDVWRGWIDLRQMLQREMFVVDTDLGLGVILEGTADPISPTADPGWDEFVADRARWLNLIPVGDALSRLDRLPSVERCDV